MEAWDAITARRQVRSFEPGPVAADTLERILDAGRRAPSSRNSQPWDFVVVSDAAKKEGLSRTWRGAGWMADAPTVLAIVMPEAEGDERLGHQFDMGQAAMQIMIAAAGLGIGSGQAVSRDQALAREVLGLPDDRRVGLLIALGHPADRPLRPIEKPFRRELADVVHYEGW